ncbi:hypothetical protein HPB50_001907 [Hyalomma asiaticum]|uniref:Uncharacterized protein n=1 Tax=Hyalomma asiaticum TaxID=266040 RepID=A0ACB7TD88_HYAAI|nr:hypothetical protein HPB50_001907 [Hyalomma asiaticum]
MFIVSDLLKASFPCCSAAQQLFRPDRPPGRDAAPRFSADYFNGYAALVICILPGGPSLSSFFGCKSSASRESNLRASSCESKEPTAVDKERRGRTKNYDSDLLTETLGRLGRGPERGIRSERSGATATGPRSLGFRFEAAPVAPESSRRPGKKLVSRMRFLEVLGLAFSAGA